MSEPFEKVMFRATMDRSNTELAIGWMRYEVTRKLNANQFAELCRRNARGERFDDMIDQLVLEHWK